MWSIIYILSFINQFFSIKQLDVYSTVTKMNSQAGMMMVETSEQYLDIFQCLKDEVTTREAHGYIDLDLEKASFDDGEDDGKYDEAIYNEGQNEYSYYKRGEDYYERREMEEYNYDKGASYYY